MPEPDRAPRPAPDSVPEWIPFRYLLAGTMLAAVLFWINVRASAGLSVLPDPREPLLHRFVLGVLGITLAAHLAFAHVYRPLAFRLSAQRPWAAIALRSPIMLAAGALGLLGAAVVTYYLHGVHRLPRVENWRDLPLPQRENVWRPLWPLSGEPPPPVLVLGGLVCVLMVEVIVALRQSRRRLERTTRALTRRETEAEVARAVQRRLLPEPLPCVPGLEIAARCDPALEVGGDYYDAFTLPGGRLAVVLADVAGKGTGAALIAATLQATIRARLDVDPDLERLVARVNADLVALSDEGHFATLFIAIIDGASGPRAPATFRYVNAGHNPALLLTDAGIVELWATGLPLGISTEERHRALDAGPASLLLLYSDGLSEARPAGGEQFGAERLRHLVQRPDPPAEVIDRLYRDINAWRLGADQQDDMTAVAVRWDRATIIPGL